jgi:hypothetical protein
MDGTVRGVLASMLALLGSAATAQPGLPEILSRVAEEAEVFQQNAVKGVTTERLEQRSILPPSRFRARAGTVAAGAPRLRFVVREVVSEYSVGSLREEGKGNLVEFRQVVEVDGRPRKSVKDARHALSLGMQSADDRLRKRMLEDFTSLGLVDVATDYGTILLAFTKRGQQQMTFHIAGAGRIGVDDAVAIDWQQTDATGGQLEFRGRRVARWAMHGLLWVRKSDGLPLRVQAIVEHPEKKGSVRDEATVDYMMSSHGFLAPASVVHRHIVDGQLLTENLYRYEPFKLFSADAEIKFTELPEAPPKK